MISVMSLIRSKADLPEGSSLATPPAPGGPGAAVAGRVYNQVIDRSQKGIEYARGGIELDAIAQVFCADMPSARSVAETGGSDLGMGIPSQLIAEANHIFCLQNTVIAVPPPGTGLKRMSILRKRPDISSEEFQEQWFGLHALLVRRLPGIQGYRQNLVLDGPRDSAGHMMIDGMVELWFPDGAAIESSFRSDIGSTTMTHAREFISEIATFLVAPTAIHGVW